MQYSSVKVLGSRVGNLSEYWYIIYLNFVFNYMNRIIIFFSGYFCQYPSNMGRVETNLLNRIYTLAAWCKELAHWKRLWCWERLKAGREGDNRGWDGWMASLIQRTWVWVNSRSWWWTGRPGVLQSMGSQRVRQDWETELNWKR